MLVPPTLSLCPLNPSWAFLKDKEERRWATWAASVGPPGSLPLARLLMCARGCQFHLESVHLDCIARKNCDCRIYLGEFGTTISFFSKDWECLKIQRFWLNPEADTPTSIAPNTCSGGRGPALLQLQLLVRSFPAPSVSCCCPGCLSCLKVLGHLLPGHCCVCSGGDASTALWVPPRSPGSWGTGWRQGAKPGTSRAGDTGPAETLIRGCGSAEPGDYAGLFSVFL